jgi:tRNA (guanine37-N1)-methyltransferase
MRIHVITLFPDLIRVHSQTAVLGRAAERGLVDVVVVDIREFGVGGYRQVDDEVFGGGPGMVLRPDVVAAAVDATPDSARRIVMAPWGRRLDQPMLRSLAAEAELTLLCGRYEGIDQRVLDARGFEPVSIGDYVLSGGEVPAMAVIEGVTRLLPGVLGNVESTRSESFASMPTSDGAGNAGLLEAPCYTRPAEWEGHPVPEVLRSGNHAEIEHWRREESVRRTARYRPDLLDSHTDAKRADE